MIIIFNDDDNNYLDNNVKTEKINITSKSLLLILSAYLRCVFFTDQFY